MEGAGCQRCGVHWEGSRVSIVTAQWTVTRCPAGSRWWLWWTVSARTGFPAGESQTAHSKHRNNGQCNFMVARALEKTNWGESRERLG